MVQFLRELWGGCLTLLASAAVAFVIIKIIKAYEGPNYPDI